MGMFGVSTVLVEAEQSRPLTEQSGVIPMKFVGVSTQWQNFAVQFNSPGTKPGKAPPGIQLWIIRSLKSKPYFRK